MADSPRVFLSGATGFIGRHVLRALRLAGYQVRALVRGPGTGIDDAETVAGDLRHPGDLLPALRGCRYLVHCAALYSFAPRDPRGFQQAGRALLAWPGLPHLVGLPLSWNRLGDDLEQQIQVVIAAGPR